MLYTRTYNNIFNKEVFYFKTDYIDQMQSNSSVGKYNK